MATQTNRTYSEFFSSGLRAMAGTSYRSSFSGCSVPVPASPDALKSSARYNVLRNLTRRTRTSSSPTSFMTPDDTTTRHRRRSSIVDLPFRLFGRMAQSADAWSLTNAPRRSDDSLRNSISYEKTRPIIDPFDGSPNSSSFFIDCVETPVFEPPSPPRRQRPQSFLLLGESTKPFSSLRFPLRRERRNSVQSMPLPSQSRRSSLQYQPPSRDKCDRSWALEEEEALSPMWIEDVEEAPDPAANIDWRQFHNDLLYEEQ